MNENGVISKSQQITAFIVGLCMIGALGIVLGAITLMMIYK